MADEDRVCPVCGETDEQPAVCVVCSQPINDEGRQMCRHCTFPAGQCLACGDMAHEECRTTTDPYWGKICPECASLPPAVLKLHALTEGKA